VSWDEFVENAVYAMARAHLAAPTLVKHATLFDALNWSESRLIARYGDQQFGWLLAVSNFARTAEKRRLQRETLIYEMLTKPIGFLA
jgi:hypothetical protein